MDKAKCSVFVQSVLVVHDYGAQKALWVLYDFAAEA